MEESRFASSFSAVADAYERGRPGYPAEAIQLLADRLGLGARSVVVDLAAGTGKLTRDLIPRFKQVIAIEPLPAMLEMLRDRVPQAEGLEGRAESMPLPDRGADAVLAAQAFHWFDGRRALTEIARVLRPGGGLGLLWNSTPWETGEQPWFDAIGDLLEEAKVDLSVLRHHTSGRWMEAFEGETRFEPLASKTVENLQRLPQDDFMAGLASRSYIAVLPASRREDLLGRIEALLQRDDAPIDDDEVLVPMRTLVFWTRLRAS